MFNQEKKKAIWINEYYIHSYEIETKGQSSLVNLCRYMQESAWGHAENLGVGFSHLIKDGLIWVLTRQQARIHRYPGLGERIKIHTWPSGREGIFYYRDFKIFDKTDNELGIASTSWCVIDSKTRKTKQIDFDITIEDQNYNPVFKKRPETLKSYINHDWQKSRTVEYSDLDIYRHVNNIRYLDWIINCFDLDFHGKHQLTEITLNFLLESRYGDELVILNKKVDNLNFVHDIMRSRDKKILCRAQTEWIPDTKC